MLKKGNTFINILTFVLMEHSLNTIMECSAPKNESVNLFLTWKYFYSIFLTRKL